MQHHRALYGLRIECGPVVLRLPDQHEIHTLADLAALGVHAKDERPFLTPWAEGSPAERAAFVRRKHWKTLGQWHPSDWQLNMGVYVDAEPTGVVMLRAQGFPVTSEVTTSSWLGINFQRQGIGTAARAALLALAFEQLSAQSARTDVFPDNAGSQGVSRKLGYEPDGISLDRRDDEALLTHRLRLSAERWFSADRPAVSITGFDACRPLFARG